MTADVDLILGIDPGMARTGYGLVEHGRGGGLRLVGYGVIRTEPDRPTGERLLQIEEELLRLTHAHAPVSAGGGKLYFDRKVTTAMTVGQARGVVLLTLARNAIAVEEYTPLEVKQAVTGNGSADKRQMQSMVRLLLGMESEPRPDDAADALAVALCHAPVRRTRQRREEAG